MVDENAPVDKPLDKVAIGVTCQAGADSPGKHKTDYGTFNLCPRCRKTHDDKKAESEKHAHEDGDLVGENPRREVLLREAPQDVAGVP